MSILTFAAVIDFTIALENDGIVHSVMAFYFVSGEPYLKSGHGSGINYHDGIIHFACYIIILLAIDNRFVECVLSSRIFLYIVKLIFWTNIRFPFHNYKCCKMLYIYIFYLFFLHSVTFSFYECY